MRSSLPHPRHQFYTLKRLFLLLSLGFVVYCFISLQRRPSQKSPFLEQFNTTSNSNSTNTESFPLKKPSPEEEKKLFEELAKEEINLLEKFHSSEKPFCPSRSTPSKEEIASSWLLDRIPYNQSLSEEEVQQLHPGLAPGGLWTPTNCRARDKMAVIVPYRDRLSHLTRFLHFLIPVLQSQNLDFRFIIVEQSGWELFNKGRLMNAAFGLAEALHLNCVFFHDVDLFPESSLIPYSCPALPRHSSGYVSSFNYQFQYPLLVGGVLGFGMEHFKMVNGYSNSFWGWGGEDDDMGKRLHYNRLKVMRPNPEFARFTMLNHTKRGENEWSKNIQVLLKKSRKNMKNDGLRQRSWSVVKAERKRLYYHLLVDVGSAPDVWKKNSSAKS